MKTKEEIAEYLKNWREENKEKLAEYKKKWYRKNKDQILEKVKEYRKSNKEKLAITKKEYYKSNKEKIAEYYKSNKDKIAIYNKEYHQKNKDKIAECKKEWRQSPKGRISMKNSLNKRRAKMKQTDITTDWLIQFEEKSKVCTTCGVIMNNDKQNNPTKKHLDHIIPINVGGKHIKDNVRYICQTCNLARPKDGRDYKLVA